MSVQGLFVTGTGTEVGKTIVSAALLLCLLERGLDAGYFKPVASGGQLHQGRLVNPDVLLVRRLSGLADSFEQMNPFCLRLPLAPLMASRLEGAPLSLDRLRASWREASGRHAFTVVEGAGGVMVPLMENLTVLDLMAQMGLPVLVVGHAGLGTINHTLLTIEAVQRRGLPMLGFCFSGPRPDELDDPAVEHNPALISEMSGVPFLGALPWLTPGPDGHITAESLPLAAREHLDIGLVERLAGLAPA